MIDGFLDMFLLCNTELRRLYNQEESDLSDDELEGLSRLMGLFGLSKCSQGIDSWDSYEIYCEEMGVSMSYEEYLESDIVPLDLDRFDDDDLY